MKVNCVIDACSYINLGKVDFLGNSVLKLLLDSTHVSYPSEIHLEVRDHYNDRLPSFLARRNNITNTQKNTIDVYERKMTGRVLPSRQVGGNKGEIDCFLLAVDMAHHRKLSGIFFITDDKNALNGNLNSWLPAFPAIKVWSSFDAIIFLYAQKVIPSKDVAEQLIQDLIANIAPPPAQRSNKTAQELIKIRTDYTNKINHIFSLCFN